MKPSSLFLLLTVLGLAALSIAPDPLTDDPVAYYEHAKHIQSGYHSNAFHEVADYLVKSAKWDRGAAKHHNTAAQSATEMSQSYAKGPQSESGHLKDETAQHAASHLQISKAYNDLADWKEVSADSFRSRVKITPGHQDIAAPAQHIAQHNPQSHLHEAPYIHPHPVPNTYRTGYEEHIVALRHTGDGYQMASETFTKDAKNLRTSAKKHQKKAEKAQESSKRYALWVECMKLSSDYHSIFLSKQQKFDAQGAEHQRVAAHEIDLAGTSEGLAEHFHLKAQRIKTFLPSKGQYPNYDYHVDMADDALDNHEV